MRRPLALLAVACLVIACAGTTNDKVRCYELVLATANSLRSLDCVSSPSTTSQSTSTPLAMMYKSRFKA
jgi:hypothetical protein